MAEHVFLCGLTEEQRKKHPSGTVLSLAKDTGNLKLELEQLRKRLVGNEPERLTDFLELASYVFAADRTTSRGPLTDPEFGARWRRSFHLIVAVRDLEFWCRSEVKETLTEALGFLSEDWWHFDFVENLHPIPMQQFFGELSPHDADAAGGTSVILFSGGLDSLAGAVHELRESNRHVVLVSHRNLPRTGKRQEELAIALAEAFPRRVTHVWVDNRLAKGLGATEETQRTRSFFFTAIATVAGYIEKADRIRFYENGIMSVNLPLATQLVGARSSRTTHPRSLHLLNQFIEPLAPQEIDNPFIWKTKAEVVSALASSPQAALIAGTVSCTHSRIANRKVKPHCGKCVQCLHRRISTIAAEAEQLEGEQYRIDLFTSPRDETLDRVMAVTTIELALDCAGISDLNFLGRFSGPLSWVLQAFPPAEHNEIAKRVIDLYRRHGEAVRNLIIREAGPNIANLVDRKLSPDSLLALVLASRLSDLTSPAVADPSPRLPEPSPEQPVEPSPPDDVVIAVDEEKRRILVRDQPQISGTAIFPIIKLLAELSLTDRSKAGLSENYQGLSAKDIADQLHLGDEESVRSAIRRARKALKEAADGLGLPFDPNALIESTGRGYRLNPKVQVIKLEEFERR